MSVCLPVRPSVCLSSTITRILGHFRSVLIQHVFSRSTGLVSQSCGLVSHPTWLGWLFGVVLIKSHAVMRGFTAPYWGYIPLCYFRHGYFGLGLTIVVLLRYSMSVDGCVWFGRTFLGYLVDWQVGGACTRAANILFFTVFGSFINV